MHFRASLFALLACVTHPAFAQGVPSQIRPGTPKLGVSVTGTFSNLAYYSEAGDLVGTEVFIFYAGKSGYFALVQCSPGFPGAPVLVVATLKRQTVEFTLPPTDNSHCPAATFKGTITRTQLKGQFNEDGEIYTLPRRSSYWDRRQ